MSLAPLGTAVFRIKKEEPKAKAEKKAKAEPVEKEPAVEKKTTKKNTKKTKEA
jgi:hypothetical protein